MGVCDLSRIAATVAAERFHARRAYTDAAVMLAEARPDVVHVLTPPQSHVPLCRQAIEAGAHVICEKPITATYPELAALHAFAREHGRHLVEDHNYRFNPTVLAMESMVEQGGVGTVSDVEVRMQLDIRGEGRFSDTHFPHPAHRLPCGIIHDFITHLCYLTLRFVPAARSADAPTAGLPPTEPRHPFQRISAFWSNHGEGPGDVFRFDDLDATLLAGAVHARIRYSSYAHPTCFTIRVTGDRGELSTDLFLPHVRFNRVRGHAQLSPLVNQITEGLTLIGSALNNFQRKVMQKTAYEGMQAFLGLVYDALSQEGLHRQSLAMPVTWADMAATSALVDDLLAPEHQR